MKRLLIAIPSPRDIDSVIQSIKGLNYDKFWAKYFNEQEAYTEMRRFFLEHTEYTHLAILPDDLTVTNAQIEKLLQRDFPIISGVCMINRGKTWENQLAVSTYPEPQSYIRSERKYHFMTKAEYEDYFNIAPGKGLTIPVTFQGFAPMIAERAVIEKIPFRDDREPNKLERGCCIDMMFGNDCMNAGIPLHVDLLVFTDHYLWTGHRHGARTYCFGTGRFKPYTLYDVGGFQTRTDIPNNVAGVTL